MEFLSEYGMFLARLRPLWWRCWSWWAASWCWRRAAARESAQRGRLDIRHLNEDYDGMALALKAATLPKKALKQARKEQKARDKQHDKTARRRPFVLNFHGDLRAAAVASLREEVTAVLTVAQPEDEVVVRLESAGGLVHGYGLAAAQLLRLRDRRIKADGGGGQGGGQRRLPDGVRGRPHPCRAVRHSRLHRRHRPVAEFQPPAQKHDIDYEQFMAGEYKRTVTIFGENTDKGRHKFQEEIETTHVLFKEFVKSHRPQLDPGSGSDRRILVWNAGAGISAGG